MSLEGPRYPRAQTIPQWKPTLILAYAFWLLCSRPDGKNGPTLLLIHVYYIKVHDSS